MDPELKAYLDTMQKTLAQEIAMSRHHAEELSRATRNDAVLKIDGMRVNLTEQMDGVRVNLTAQLDGTRLDLTQQIAESRQYASPLNQETRILVEDVKHLVQLVAEGITTLRHQLGRKIDDHEVRISRLERRGP